MQNVANLVWFTNLLTSDALEIQLWNLCWTYEYCTTTGSWIISISLYGPIYFHYSCKTNAVTFMSLCRTFQWFKCVSHIKPILCWRQWVHTMWVRSSRSDQPGSEIFPLNISLAPTIFLTCMRSFSRVRRVISTPPPSRLLSVIQCFWCRLNVRKGRLVSGSAMSCSQCSTSSRFLTSCNFFSGAVHINSFMTAWEHSALCENDLSKCFGVGFQRFRRQFMIL